jgi:hypothetical protein
MDVNRKIKKAELEFLKIVYENTQTNITRYCDREWAVPGIFIAAIITTIGFILTNKPEAKQFAIYFGVFLICLSLGNIFYLLFTHARLTKQRKILIDLQHLFSQNGYIDPLAFPYPIAQPNEFAEFTHGLWDHVFIFIVSGVLLGFTGIFVLCSI